MLTIRYEKGAPAIPDFEAQDWVNYNIDSYVGCSYSKVVRTSNELVLLMFGNKVLEGIIPVNEIEFYFNGDKLEFDPVLGLQNPPGKVIGFYNQVVEEALHLSYNLMKKNRENK